MVRSWIAFEDLTNLNFIGRLSDILGRKGAMVGIYLTSLLIYLSTNV
jgi:hypothetical protein